MPEPIWISVDLALAIHQRQLAEHGGSDGVRDRALLDSALDRPRQLYAFSDPTPPVPELAAAYAIGIARNHAFIDRNKRTAYAVCRSFMVLNGFDITATRENRYEMFLALAASEIDDEHFAEWLTRNSSSFD